MITLRRLPPLFGIVIGGLVSLAANAAETVDHANDPWPLTDVFETPPPRAHAQPGTSCVTAERYVESAIAQKGAEVGSYFAEDAAFLDPFGALVIGRKAIMDWYEAHRGVVVPHPVSFNAVGRECFMEAAGHMNADPDPRLHLVVIDHFTMNEKNEIVRAVFYFRGGVAAVKRVPELEAEIKKLKQAK